MLEKMEDFFDARVEAYDRHQLSCIASAREFLAYTAQCLPGSAACRILDLGCGTGLELEYYFKINGAATITGIDMAPKMLQALREKFGDKTLNLICASYFDVPFGKEKFDAAVSVESLHHYSAQEKAPLYCKLREALKPGGFFILTDYFALSEAEEEKCRQNLLHLKHEQGITDNAFYHYDTPLTVGHETACLKAAGFRKVEVLKQWGATCTIKADK